MLKIDNLKYESTMTIIFQRMTVILISDLIFFISLHIFFQKYSNDEDYLKNLILSYFSPSLILVDSKIKKK
jgi:hypothetical protein